jgi:hypothetical protein
MRVFRLSWVGLRLALGDLVKSTLGPKGMNKFCNPVSSGDINVTDDGATVFKAIQLDNAAAANVNYYASELRLSEASATMLSHSRRISSIPLSRTLYGRIRNTTLNSRSSSDPENYSICQWSVSVGFLHSHPSRHALFLDLE